MLGKWYRVSANVITGLHFAWTLFLIAGAATVFFYHPFAWFQIGIMSFTLLINIPFGGHCPLTVWEEKLRRKVDAEYSNQHSYMTTYLNKVFHADIKVRTVNIVTSILYIASYLICVWVLVRG